ncbi:MAG: hypothetical protein IPI01_19495 [Ignavibacteriae bacterium]|nr:hypothetical protein [Ignavibacteriota bacterium]
MLLEFQHAGKCGVGRQLNYGLDLNPLDDLILTNCKFDGNIVGLKIATTAGVTHVTDQQLFLRREHAGVVHRGDETSERLDILQCDCHQFYVQQQPPEGIYAEKLEDALFDGITVTTAAPIRLQSQQCGIDINLKYGTYQNIQIINSTITGSGATGQRRIPPTLLPPR